MSSSGVSAIFVSVSATTSIISYVYFCCEIKFLTQPELSPTLENTVDAQGPSSETDNEGIFEYQ